MSLTIRRQLNPRRTFKKCCSLLITMLVASLLGVTSSTPAAEAQQPPTPQRPLLLIGGTFVGTEFEGAYLDDEFIEGWTDIKTCPDAGRLYP